METLLLLVWPTEAALSGDESEGSEISRFLENHSLGRGQRAGPVLKQFIG